MSQRRVSHDTSRPIELSPALSHIFATLQPAAVEQFYQSYQLWLLQQQLELLQTQIATVRQQISENEQRMRFVQPSSVALAALVRLQSQGVNDIALLERMLAKGEAWLDETMQLLDLCEQLGMLHNDYTTWCEHALEGAYNWVASMQGQMSSETVSATVAEPGEDIVSPEQITEEMLLQKLMSEQDEETVELPTFHAQQPTVAAEETPSYSQDEAVSIVAFEAEPPDLPVQNEVVTPQTEVDGQPENLSVDEEAVHAVQHEPDEQAEMVPLTEEVVETVEQVEQSEIQATQPEVAPLAEDTVEQVEAKDTQTAIALEPEDTQVEAPSKAEEGIEQITISTPDEPELPSFSSPPESAESAEETPAVSTEPQADTQDVRVQSTVMTAVFARVSTEQIPQKRTRKRGFFSFLFSLFSASMLLVTVSFVVGWANPA